MKTHFIKLNIEFCDAVLSGEKTFEVRENDKGYQKGDHIKFRPVKASSGETLTHSISQTEYEITYVLSGWGLKEGYVAFGIKEVSE